VTQCPCWPEEQRRAERLRGCSGALLAGSKPALASCSRVADGGDRWLLMAVRGHAHTRRSSLGYERYDVRPRHLGIGRCYAGRLAAGPIRSRLKPSGRITRSSMRAPWHMSRILGSPGGQGEMPVGWIRRHRGVSAGLTSRRQIRIMRVCGSSWRQFSSDTGASGRSAMRRRSSSEVSLATARMQTRNFLTGEPWSGRRPRSA
jgi:hypothetical protein